MLLSIITINLNNAKGLRQTINSVSAQTRNDFEFIIIDGNSGDESVSIIKACTSVHHWVSEKDTGVYNAMNKGIKKASGEFLLFLNSGDIFYDKDVLKNFMPEFGSTDIVYGDLLIRQPGEADWIKHYNELLNFEYFTRDTLPHQGSFIKKQLFSTVGLYDESLKICADWKFFMDAVCKYNVTVKYIPTVIAIYDYTGISSQTEFHPLQNREKLSVIEKDYPMYAVMYKELLSLRNSKAHYDDLKDIFFVRAIFMFTVKGRMLKKKIKNFLKR